MSAQLPYLAPPNRYPNDVQSVAQGAAEDVKNATSIAAKAGAVTRGALAAVPAVLNTANNVVGTPYRLIRNAAGDYIQAVTGGPAPAAPATPALGLPALATPGVSTPATHQPITAAAAPGSVSAAPPTSPAWQQALRDDTAAQNGTSVAVPVASAPMFTPATSPGVRMDPVRVGMIQQAHFADQQRQAVLEAAEQAAATGNPLNATARYMAALHALPTLSGPANFAGNQTQVATAGIDAMQRDLANVRASQAGTYGSSVDAEAKRYSADVGYKGTALTAKTQAENLKHNVQTVPIGQTIGQDPVTGMAVPITQYGVATPGGEGQPPTIVDLHTGQQLGVGRGAAPAPAALTVGTKTKYKDGTYALNNGRKAVVKSGVVTELQ